MMKSAVIRGKILPMLANFSLIGFGLLKPQASKTTVSRCHGIALTTLCALMCYLSVRTDVLHCDER